MGWLIFWAFVVMAVFYGLALLGAKYADKYDPGDN